MLVKSTSTNNNHIYTYYNFKLTSATAIVLAAFCLGVTIMYPDALVKSTTTTVLGKFVYLRQCVIVILAVTALTVFCNIVLKAIYTLKRVVNPMHMSNVSVYDTDQQIQISTGQTLYSTVEQICNNLKENDMYGATVDNVTQLSSQLHTIFSGVHGRNLSNDNEMAQLITVVQQILNTPGAPALLYNILKLHPAVLTATNSNIVAYTTATKILSAPDWYERLDEISSNVTLYQSNHLDDLKTLIANRPVGISKSTVVQILQLLNSDPDNSNVILQNADKTIQVLEELKMPNTVFASVKQNAMPVLLD
jgi:hypothetical protein